MSPTFRWLHRLAALVRADRLHGDLDDELQFHIEARTRDNITQGMTPEEARLAAIRLFGNRTVMAERMRDADVNRWLDAGLRNLRYSARVLRRNPGFTIVVVLSMALGIGANTAIFSLLNALLLKTLPVKNPHELVVVEVNAPDMERSLTARDRLQLNYQTFREDASQAIDLFVTTWTSAVTTLDDQVEEISVGLVSGNYYAALGVEPFLGRLLVADDDSRAAPVAVLDYDFWRTRFGADPGITGRAVVLNGVPFSIVGVAPRGFVGTSLRRPPSLTVPVQSEKHLEANGFSMRSVEGRLRPGVSRQQAASVLTTLLQATPRHRDAVAVLRDNSRGEFRDRDRFTKPVYVLMAGVLLVLLIASANVASLLLARGTARRREISIRLAIGASRSTIAWQFLTESVLIALCGAAVGVALAYPADAALLAILGTGANALPLDVRPDARVLLFTTCTSVLTGLLFGLFPAFQAARAELNPTLKEATGIVGRRQRPVARRALVVAQIALSLVLLAGAVLFGRTLQNLRTFDSGYDRRGVLLAYFEHDRRHTKERRYQFQNDLLDRVRALPGVESAGMASTPVLSSGGYSMPLGIEGQAARCNTSMTIASAGYLETMRMTLIAGRMFTAADNQAEAPHTIIVNQEIARRCFGSVNPVGRRVKAGGMPDVDAEVIGVVTDAKYRNLREDPLAMYYIPPRSVHPYGLELHVRTALDPHTLAEPIRRAARDLDPTIPLTSVSSLEEQSERSIVQDRLLATVSTTFGVGALALAAIGLHGVLAFIVARRTNEIGLRMALGARRLQVVRLILAESTSLLIVGCLLGAIGAYIGQRLIQGLSFGVSDSDQWSLLVAATVLFAVALAASLVPAGRAARIDPIAALRHE